MDDDPCRVGRVAYQLICSSTDRLVRLDSFHPEKGLIMGDSYGMGIDYNYIIWASCTIEDY